MKCVRCQHDSKLSERKNGCCPLCGGEFAFETKQGWSYTDTRFAKAIARVSSEGHVRWGVEHLYYELARREWSTKRSLTPVLLPALFAAIILVAARLWVLLVFLAVLVLVGVIYRLRPGPALKLKQDEFQRHWHRWLKVHERPKGLITRKELPPGPPPKRELESDITAYSFDRAVICDRARTVDLLLANNFHFENNCAVLSIDGYPKHVAPMVRHMLRQNPRLMVFALHDATPEGATLAHRLAHDAEWFRGVGRVVDVGLRPAHAQSLRGLWRRHEQRRFLGNLPGVTPKEREWLALWTVELAAVRPEQVIKRLFRAISAYPEGATADGSDVAIADVWIFGSDAGASDGGGDSFG